MVEEYPLSWPNNLEMSLEGRESIGSPWTKDFTAAKKDLMFQVRRFKPKKAILSTNVPVDSAGWPFIPNYKQPKQAGAAVYFDYQGRAYAMGCADYLDTAANMVSLKKTLQALFTLKSQQGDHFFNSIMDKFLLQGYSSTFKILGGDDHGGSGSRPRPGEVFTRQPD